MNGALNFDDGTISLAVNGEDRIFRFNPTDTFIYEGFMKLFQETPDKVMKLSERATAAAEKDLSKEEQIEEELKLRREIDGILRDAFDEIFGAGQAEIVFGRQNVSAMGSNGQIIFVNGLMAIYPFFEKETNKRNAKVQKLIQDHKPKRK